MTVIVIVILMLVWILCILLAALIGLGLAAWVLSENYDALSDACADQASVWAWTAIALPTFAAGLTMLMLMKYTGCMDRIGCTKGTPQLIIPVVLLQGSLIALSIFGVCAWVFEGEECGAHFYHDYTSLYVLFRIVVILGCVIGLYLLIEMVVLFTIFMLIALGYTDQDSDFLRHNRNYGNSHHWALAESTRYQTLNGDNGDTEDADSSPMDEQLRTASAKGDMDEVVRLLDAGARLQSRARSTGNTAFHEAALAGHTEVCKKLVLAGASAGSQNLLGQTPLSLASHAETREYLRSLQSDSEQRAQEQFLQAAAATSEVV